ncbi:hypothetical protein [Nonomuraea dietziae]|uniref:hypothetical protein n=1 Tax=Nonomuraea dietziae TaxID=65515 RepID=UPI0031DE800E
MSSSTPLLRERARQIYHARSGAGGDRQEPRVADDGAGGGDALPLPPDLSCGRWPSRRPSPTRSGVPAARGRRPRSEGPSGAAIRHGVRRRYPGWSRAGITVREDRPGVW